MPAQLLRRLKGAGAAGGQIGGVQLVDVRLGICGGLPGAEQLHRLFRGHVQIDHQIRPGQAQLVVLELVQPAEKGLPLLRGTLGPLMDGVGGGVAVGQDEPAVLIVLAPHLAPGGVAVHSVEGGGGIGAYVLGVGAELPAQVHADEGGGGLVILGEHQPPIAPPHAVQPVTQLFELGGLARAVGALEHDKLAVHAYASPFLSGRMRWPAAFTRTRGSLAMRPMRFGSFFRR